MLADLGLECVNSYLKAFSLYLYIKLYAKIGMLQKIQSKNSWGLKILLVKQRTKLYALVCSFTP